MVQVNSFMFIDYSWELPDCLVSFISVAVFWYFSITGLYPI